jgi:hypothetical protein
MTNRSHTTKDARKLEKLYDTKSHGVSHSTVLRLIQERGLDGAIEQLEAWGMKRVTGTIEPEPEAMTTAAALTQLSDRFVEFAREIEAACEGEIGIVVELPDGSRHAWNGERFIEWVWETDPPRVVSGRTWGHVT